jgi:hypothetical protein
MIETSHQVYIAVVKDVERDMSSMNLLAKTKRWQVINIEGAV